MNKKFFGVLAGSSTFGVLLAGSLPLPVLAQQQNSTAAVIAAEESAQQAATTATIAAEEAAQQASTTATIAAEEAAQQAATTAVIAAEEAAQQAATTAVIAAEEAAQQAATTATIAAEEAAQQAATTATIAAEEAAQQAATTATIAAEEAAQQAATTATIAAEEAAQQAATTATIAAEEAAQQAATTATIAAEEAAQQAATTATIAVEGSTNLNSGSSLHFGSEAEHYTAPNSAPVEIIVGGELSGNGTVTGGQTRTINPGESVTAAELEAIEHVMLTGAQSLLLNADGHAVGGHVTLTSTDFHSATDLFVPESVSLSLINFNAASPLTVADNASILGSVYAFHDTHGVESVLNFGSLNVESTGLLSGGLPTGSMFGGYFASSGLTITTATSVVNAGTISSPGALAVNAGTTITNTGLMTGGSVTLSAQQAISNAGTIQALAGSLNLNSGSGQYINSGMMSALNNINVASSQAAQNADINFDNNGGVLEAANSINFRDDSFDEKANLYIEGGDLLSSELNLNSGRGIAEAYVQDLTGVVNVSAHDIKVTAHAENVTIGNVIATGDPLFGNSLGDFTIAGLLSGPPLSIIAFGDILSTGGSLDSAGGTMFLAAGVNFQGTIATGGTITGPASPDGGQIDLQAVTSITTGGGELVAVAYDGNGVNSGRIRIGPTITTNGGNVTIIADDGNTAATNSLEVGTINTTGGAVGTGNITLAVAQLPTSVNVTVDAAGNAVGLNQFTVGAGRDRGILVNGDLIANGATIELTAGNGGSGGSILVNGAGGINNTPTTAGSGGTVTINQNTNSGPFVVGGATTNGIVAASGIQSAANTTGNGGTINITNSGTGGVTINNASASLNAAAAGTGNGATFNIQAPNGPLSITGSIVANAAGSGNGGSITLNGDSVVVPSLPSNLVAIGVGGGDGGNVTVTSASATTDLVIGGLPNQFGVFTFGDGNGGSIQFSSGRNLTVDPVSAGASPVGANGNGGTFEFIAGTAGNGTVQVTGNLDANGVGTGDGGRILLQANAPTALDIGGVTAGNLTAQGQNGGSIEVRNLGTGGVNVNGTGNINVTATNGNGGSIIVDTPGPVNLPGGSYNADGAGASGNGGTVSITGSTVNSTGFVNLQANGSGTGNGGTVELIGTDPGTSFTLDTAGAGNFSLTAQGGGTDGDGGTATVRAGGNITVNDVASFAINPQAGTSNGGVINAEAGFGGNPGNLLVNGTLTNNGINGGNGGEVNLTSNSATTFTIGNPGNPGTNGVIGQILADGGTGNAGQVRIVNNGTGGITLLDANDITISGTAGNGVYELRSPLGTITVPTGTIDVGGDTGGTINIIGLDFVTPGTGPINLLANGATGAGGSVTFNTTAAGSNIIVGDDGTSPDDRLCIVTTGATDGGSATVVAGGNLTVNDDAACLNVAGANGNGGSITLEAGRGGAGDLFVDRTLDVSATSAGGNGGSLSLTTNSGGTFNLGTGSGSPGVDGVLIANNGATGGNGGSISVVNNGNGGLNIGATTNVSVGNANTQNGGTINLDATSGALTIPVTGNGTPSATNTLDASGAVNGGTICLNGDTITALDGGPGANPLTIDVSGGTGTAGTAKVTQGSGNLNIGNGSGDISINNTGNGGVADCVNIFNIDIQTAGTLTFDPGSINIGPNPNADGVAVRLRSDEVFVGTVANPDLDVSGVGTGNGGCIVIETNTANDFLIGNGAPTTNGTFGNLIANSGGSGGAGGTIRVTNNGTGGITVDNTNTNITVNAMDGNGGEILLNASGTANTGILSANAGTTIQANAGNVPSGNDFQGGTITLFGGQIINNSGNTITLNAQGIGDGRGGDVTVRTFDAALGDINVGGGGGQIIVDVTSPGGDGGTITLDAARSLIANANQIAAQGIGNDAAGGTINLFAGRLGNSGSVLQVNGTPNVNGGTGNGAGGNINIRLLQEAGETFFIGGDPGGADHFIGDGTNTALNAQGTGVGAGGNITIQNTSSGDPLNISWFNDATAASILADSPQGIPGNVTFMTAGGSTPAAGESIAVALDPFSPIPPGTTPPPNNIGDIKGLVTAIGTDVFLQTEANNARLDILNVRATTGIGTIYARIGSDSTVVIGEGRQAITALALDICTHIVDLNGLISSAGGNINLCSLDNLTLTGDNGRVTTGGGNVVAEVTTPGGTLTIDNNWTVDTQGGDAILRSCSDATNSIVFNADRNMRFDGGGTGIVSSPNINFNNNSGVQAVAGGGSSIELNSCGDFDLNVNLNGIANIASDGAGSSIAIGTGDSTPGSATNRDVSFNNSGGTPQINLNAGGGNIDVGNLDSNSNPNTRIDDTVVVEATNAQNLRVHTENLTMEQSSVLRTADATTPAAPITIDNQGSGATANLTVTTEGTGATAATIETNSTGTTGNTIAFNNVNNGEDIIFTTTGGAQELNINSRSGNTTATVNGGGEVNITSDATINNVAASTIINANDGTFRNDGQLNSNSAAALNNFGFIQVLSTGSLDIPSVGTVNVAPNTIGGGQGGRIDINATGALTLGDGVSTSNTLNASAVTDGNGGIINITGDTIAVNYPGASPLTLNANAAGTGNGGTITVRATNAVNGDITSGIGTGDIAANARGGGTSGNGGTVTFDAANDLSLTGATGGIDVGTTNGDGGTVNLTASSGSGTGTLTIAGGTTISAAGSGTGDGGDVNITSNSDQLLFIDRPIDVSAGTTGDGGSITIRNTGNGVANGGIDIDTNLVANAASTAAPRNGGSITIDSKSGAVDGIVNISSALISVNGVGADGLGGTILIEGAEVNFDSGAAQQLLANGSGRGRGGTITVRACTTDIDTVAGGSLDIQANGGSGFPGGDGGTITLEAADDINAPGLISATAGPTSDGGRVDVTANTAGGAGTVTDLGSINVDGGSVVGSMAGTVNVTAHSTATLNLANTITANSFNGDAGTITIRNDGLAAGNGGINIAANLIARDLNNGGAGGTIVIDAKGVTDGIVNIDAPAISAIGGTAGGSVTIEGASVNFTNSAQQTVNANATSSLIPGSDGGTITIRACDPINGNITAASNAGDLGLRLFATGSGPDGDGGDITLEAGNNVSIGGTNSVITANASFGGEGDGGTVSITANTGGTAGTIDTNAAINAKSNGNGTGGVVTLTANSSSTLTVNQLVDVSPGNNGVGGSITIRNTGNGVANGGVDINSDLIASAVSPGPPRNGGSVTIDSKSGAVDGIVNISSNLISANAAGNGSANGGSILIEGAAVNFDRGAAQQLQANGVRQGRGGAITVRACAGDIDTSPGGSLDIQANGGGGLAGGDGGTITLEAADEINAPGSVSATGGSNADGGTVNVTANTAGGAGTVTNLGSINVNTGGVGTGGTVTITANSTATANIANSITANTSRGDAGSITIINDGLVAGNGGINIGTAANLETLTANNGGAGGTIVVDAKGVTDGIVNIDAPTISANGGTAGGSVTIEGASVNFTNASLQTVNASAAHPFILGADGGTITIRACDPLNGNITAAPNAGDQGLQLLASGGGPDGDGGNITLEAGNNVSIGGTNSLISVDAPQGSSNLGDGGTVSITANTGGNAGTITTDATINARPARNGTGGDVTLIANSTATLAVNSAISVSGVAVPPGFSNSAGNIIVRNEGIAAGNGGITVSQNLTADAFGDNSTAGSITLDAKSNLGFADGLVTINPVTFTANGGGNNSNGGTILVEGSSINFTGAGPQVISADAGTTGDGGSITLRSCVGNLNLGGAGGDVQIFARGNSGDGGTAALEAGGSITANGGTGSLDVSANGAGDHDGGNIALRAGTNGVGTVQVNSALNANGTNNGNGGTIAVQFNDPIGNPLTIGSNVGSNFINGSITADSPGNGNGGTITIANLSSTGTAQPLDVDLTNNAVISANSSTAANIGNLNFNYNSLGNPVGGAAINVSGAGSLNGFVNAEGTSVFINPQVAGTTVNVGTILATGGNAEVVLDCNSGTIINVGPGNSIRSTTANVNLTANTVNVQDDAGPITEVDAQVDVNITTNNLNNVGQILARTGNVNVTSCNPGDALIVDNSGNGSITSAGANGIVNIDSQGNLTLNGDGTVATTGAGNTRIQFRAEDTGAFNLNVDNTYTLQPTNDAGVVDYSAQGAGGAINFVAGANQTVQSGGEIEIHTGALNLGDGTVIQGNAGTTNVTIDTGNVVAQNLSISIPTAATIAGFGAGSTVNIGPTPGLANGRDLNFNNGAAGAARLNMRGDVIVTARSAGSSPNNSNVRVDSNVTLSGDSNVTFNLNGGGIGNDPNATTNLRLANNSLIESTSNIDGTAITIQTTDTANAVGGFWVISNGGSIDLAGDPANGRINIQAPDNHLGTTLINVTTDTFIAPNTLTLDAGTGAGALTNIRHAAESNVISFGNQLQLNVVGGESLEIAGGGRIDTGGATITNTVAGAPINISNGVSTFAFGETNISGSGTFQTTDGNVNITTNVANQRVRFGFSALQVTTFNVGTGTVNVTVNNDDILIPGTITADGIINLNANNGSITNNGTIRSHTVGAAGTPGRVNLLSTGTLLVNEPGTINVAPLGAGDGGQIDVIAAGALTLGNGVSTNNTLNADAVTSGNGGTINIEGSTITNNFGGGNPLILTADGAGANGAGGNVRVEATSGDITTGGAGGEIQVTATGSGSGDGGTATITAGGNVNIGGASSSIDVSAGATGNGGIVRVTANTDNAGSETINLNVGINATGGVTSGDGGTIELLANTEGQIDLNQALDVSTSGGNGGTILVRNQGTAAGNGGIRAQQNLDASGAGANGNGGSITLDAKGGAGGNNGPVVLGSVGTPISLTADATSTGDGNGGTILIEGSSITPNLLDVSANAGANGDGGTITFTSCDADLTIALNNTISARGGTATGNLGTLNFNAPGFNVNVAGPGTMFGLVNSNGSSVFINPQGAGSQVDVGTILATAGDASVILDCNSATAINIAAGNSIISNTGQVRLEAQTIDNDGTVRGQTDVRLRQNTLDNNGVIDAVTGDVFIDVCVDNAPLAINLNAPGSITADNGNINLNTDAATAGGTITVAGNGTLGSNAAGNINVGVTGERNTVDIDAGDAVGCVQGFGTTFDVTIVNNNATLAAGNIQATGDINLTALGQSADFITCDGGISTTGGSISINAGAVGFDNSTVDINHNLLAGPAGNVSVVSLGLLNSTVTFTGSTVTAGNNVTVASGAGNNSHIVVNNSPITGGNNVSILTGAIASSDVTIGTGSPIQATNGSVTIASGSLLNSDVVVNSDVTAANGSATFTSGSLLGGTDRVEFGNGVDVLANSATVNAPNLVMAAGNNSITATGANQSVTIDSNAASNALSVTMGANSSINAANTGGDILFNPSGAGSINVAGAGEGVINANDLVSLNGGAANNVTVNVDTVNGCIIGSGNNVSIQSDNPATDLNIGSATANLTAAGTMTLSSGRDVNFKQGATSAGGLIDVDAGRDVTVGSVAEATLTSTGGNVDIDAVRNFTLTSNGNSAVNANAGSVDIQITNGRISTSNDINAQGDINLTSTNGGAAAPNDGRVTIGDAAASNIVSTAGNININTNGPDADVLIGNGGAANLQANGAGGTVTVNAVGSNSDFFIGGTQNSSISANSNVAVTAGDGLVVGNGAQGAITSTNGNVNLTANGASGEGILFGRLGGGNGVVTANNGSVTMNATTTSVNVGANGANSVTAGTTLTVNTQRLDVGTGDSLTATGNVLVQGTGAGNSLAVNFLGAGSEIVSTGADVTFNDAGSPGAITVTGGASNFGTIAADGGGLGAGNITFNGGNNPVDAYANEFRGCVNGTGSPFNARANTGTVNGTANTVGYGNITSDQTINLTGPNVFLCGDVTTTTAGANVNVITGDLTNGTTTHGNDADINSAGDVNYTTTRVVMNTDASATAAGVINIQGNTTGANANSITFDFAGTNTSLVSNNAGPGANNINFNPTAAGQITVTGGPGNGLIDAGAVNNVTYNGNNGTNNDVSVNVNQIIGCNTGDGNNVSITTVEDLFVGPFTATGTASFIATGAGSDVVTCGNVTSAGALIMDAGSGDADVIINNGHQVQGSSVQLVSGTGAGAEVFIGNGNASVTATTGDATITTLELDMASGSNSINATLGSITVSQPNAASLAVNLGANSSLNATAAGQDINFNGTGININGGGEGLINANDVVALNGSGGVVSLNADQVNGCITGEGTTVTVTTDNPAADLNIGTATADLNSTAGDVTITSGRNVNFKGDSNATGGDLNVNTVANGQVDLQSGADIGGDEVNISGNTINMANGVGSSITANTGDVNIQNNGAGDLTINMQNNTNVTSTNGNVNFNPTTASGVDINGTSGSTIAANGGNGNISYNSAGNNVDVEVGNLNGMNTGASVNADFDVLNGTLQIGPYTATGDMNLNQQAPFGPTNANVTLKDTVAITGNLAATTGTAAQLNIQNNGGNPANITVGGTANLNTPTVDFVGDNGSFTATGDLTIQSNAPGGALTVDSTGANNTTLASTGGNINFNPTTAGAITISGGAGTLGLAATILNYNGGNAGNVTVDIDSIAGCNQGTGNNISFTTSNVNSDILVGTAAGGNLTAAGTLTLNSARDVIFKGGDSTATGTVDIDAGRDVIVADNANASVTTNGDINIDAGDGVNIGNNGVGSLLSNNGNIAINAAGASGSGSNDLNIGVTNAASGSSVQATNGNVSLGTTGNNSEVRVGFDGDGSVVAGGTVSITTTGTDSDIDIGDDGGAGSVTAGGDITFNSADGVTVGDDSQGTVTSTNGNISITANDDSLVVADEAGANGSFIRADNGNVTLLANGPNTDIEIGDTGNGSIIASGSISATTTGVNGDIKVGEDTGATGNVNAGGDITFNANDGVSIGEDGVGTVTSTNGNISITANGASGFPVNDLSIGLNSGSDGSAVNATNGNVTLTTTGTNSINVGTGGNASVTAGNNFIVDSAADVNIGNTGAGTTGTVTANNGTGAITSGSGDVNIADNSNTSANGNLNIDAAGTTALNVNMGNNAFVTSTTGSVSFQQAGAGNEGQITVNGGTINSAGCIDYHVGPNPVSVDVEAINSPLGNRVLTSGANPASIFFQTQNSDINFCAGTDLNTSSIGAGGPITITANNGMVDLNGNNVIANGIGNGGPINISGSTGILNGGTISSNSINGNGGPITLNGGTGNVQTGSISSSSINGNGGDTNVTAGGNINTGSINVSSINGNAGNITTNSGGDTNTGTLFATSTSGNGGNINSTSGGDLITGPVLAFANGGGTGGSFTGTANNGTISVGGVINVSSTNGQGGNVTTTSENVMIGGGINLNGGTNGGILDLTTTDQNNPLVVGGGGPNSINGNVTANGTNGNGGTIMFTSNDLTQNAGNIISANGGQNGGVVTFNPQDPSRFFQTYNINGIVCADGTANPNTGVVGFGSGGNQNLFLNVGATGNIKAGQQITIGNLDPNTGLPVAPPSGLIVVSPQPGGSPSNPIFAMPPFSSPLVVVNGTLFFPPPPPTPPIDGIGGTGTGNPFASLFALLALQNANQNLFIPLMPRDQTELSGYVRQDEEKETDPQVNRVLQGCKTFESNFASGNSEHQRLSKLLELGQLNQDGLLDLKVGNAFVSPQDGSTSVKTNDCQVLIAKNAGVFISEDGNDTAIFNLHQRMPGGVKVVVGNKMIDLPPGRMILVSRQKTKNFNAVKHQAKIIGYRNPSYYNVNKDMDVFVADFSIPSALMKIKPLRDMSKSKNRTDKKVFKKLLMNAVLLQEHSRGRGRFMTPPGGLFNQQSGGI